MYGGVGLFSGGIVCFSYVLFVIQIFPSRSLAYSIAKHNDSADGMTLDELRK